ncbi:MAG TPA: AmmeMemoRadiSam system protein B [Candidatus Binatia bacterium]|nr:AmmeMemoRadiSam system protein B [Candidatus Binatia bacterium]
MDYPKLRPIEAFPVEVEGETRIYIRDPLNYTKNQIVVSYPVYFILSHFDGRHSLLDVQEAFARQFGQVLASDKVREIVDQLDQFYFLDSERFARLQQETLDAFRLSPVREMAHADTCYSSQAEEFTKQAVSFFGGAEGPGLPSLAGQPHPPVRGIIAPHIDLRVGGPCYAWAYKELAERCDADLFILLGTSHYGIGQLFVATEKDYGTPLGVVKTDREFIRALQQHYSGDLFTDEILHRTEHSLEFQTLFLQYVLGGRRDFSVVPILVSSFHHLVVSRTPPAQDPRVAAFLGALKETIARSGHKVCFVAGVDFAHVGQKFGDRGPLTQEFLDWVKAEDHRLIQALEKVDHADFFAQIAKDGDRRRICGFSPMYTFLHLVEATQGKLLKYDRSVESATQSSVSFASLAFY